LGRKWLGLDLRALGKAARPSALLVASFGSAAWTGWRRAKGRPINQFGKSDT